MTNVNIRMIILFKSRNVLEEIAYPPVELGVLSHPQLLECFMIVHCDLIYNIIFVDITRL